MYTLYKSKAGEIRSRKEWQEWIDQFYSWDESVIAIPKDQWERTVRVLGLEEVVLQESADIALLYKSISFWERLGDILMEPPNKRLFKTLLKSFENP